MTEQELFAVLDDLARKVLARIRGGESCKLYADAPEMEAIDALEKVYPAEYARWVGRAKD